jgi:polyisoprenoid-binding protein YceI
MSLKSKLLLGGAGLAVAGIALGAAAWYLVLRNDAPPPVSLASALEAIASPEAPANATSQAAAATTTSDASLTGTWTLLKGANSFVGYRVDETLVGVGATTAVGRTSNVEGTLEFDGSAITAVQVTADLTTLASDKTMRDGQLRTQAIETNQFPTASFVLTSPIQIGEAPADGETVVQTIQGELTLHGVTNAIEIKVEGVLQNGQLVVVGSTVIQFDDYNINQPTSMSVVSIEDHGTMELQLVFTRA